LQAIAQSKAPNALDVLTAAVQTDSPDDTLRRAALRAFGDLADDKAAPFVLEWSALGKPLVLRAAAIRSLGPLDRGNKEITKAHISYVNEGHRDVLFSAIFALGSRGDPDAIPALEEAAKNSGFDEGASRMITGQIQAIRAAASGKGGGGGRPGTTGAGGNADVAATPVDANGDLAKAVEKIEQQLDEVNARVRKIEAEIGNSKK
jgi:hypothetical protein